MRNYVPPLRMNRLPGCYKLQRELEMEIPGVRVNCGEEGGPLIKNYDCKYEGGFFGITIAHRGKFAVLIAHSEHLQELSERFSKVLGHSPVVRYIPQHEGENIAKVAEWNQTEDLGQIWKRLHHRGASDIEFL